MAAKTAATATPSPSPPATTTAPGGQPPKPPLQGSILSLCTFGWVGPLVRQGFQGPVALDDLWALQAPNAASVLEATRADAASRPTWRLLLGVARARLLAALCFACVYSTTQVGGMACNWGVSGPGDPVATVLFGSPVAKLNLP